MRIIDKLQDYYDYLQDYDDNLVFDRRGSYLITKQDICDSIERVPYNESFTFYLINCGATYWLLYAIKTKTDGRGAFAKVLDYKLGVVATWKNYDNEFGLLKFEQIRINSLWEYSCTTYDYKIHCRFLEEDKLAAKADDLKNAIIHKDYVSVYRYDIQTKWIRDNKGNIKETEITYPILKACGISNLIEPDVMYHAIDEYFSLMKQASETTVAQGTTNEDKIVNHGFDKKTSFRGKNKK